MTGARDPGGRTSALPEGAGKMTTTEGLRARMDATAERLEAEKAKLYRPDGSKLYADEEHEERLRSIEQEHTTAFDAIEADVGRSISRAQEDLLKLEHSDPVDLLSNEELERANSKSPFVLNECLNLPPAALTKRLSAVLASGTGPPCSSTPSTQPRASGRGRATTPRTRPPPAKRRGPRRSGRPSRSSWRSSTPSARAGSSGRGRPSKRRRGSSRTPTPSARRSERGRPVREAEVRGRGAKVGAAGRVAKHEKGRSPSEARTPALSAPESFEICATIMRQASLYL